jgi:hypothetical protein
MKLITPEMHQVLINTQYSKFPLSISLSNWAGHGHTHVTSDWLMLVGE